MRRYGFRLTMLVVGALAVAATGCRRAEFTYFPVEGTVTKSGRPLRGIEVVFIADLDTGTVGPRATGRTDEAGHYRLRTDHDDDGAVTGKHRVVLLDPEAAKGRMGRVARGPQPKEAMGLSPEDAKRLEEQLKPATASRLPPHYGSFSETPLRVEVQPGSQVIDLEVP